MTNEELIHQLYSSFGSKHPDGMAQCYHPEAIFMDPVFGRLEGPDIMAMWRMLIERGGDQLDISYGNVWVRNETGSAIWEAQYSFSKTGRPIHNCIEAQFKFRNGQIIEHIDTFDLYKWTVMAFGWKGRLLGWTSFFQNKIRSIASKGLQKWKAKNPKGV